MQFDIPAELASFMQQEVSSGRFASQEELMLAGIRLLKQDREEALAGIRQGIAEWQRGEGAQLDDVFARLREKYGLDRDS